MARQLFGFEADRGRGSAFDQTKTTTKTGKPRIAAFGKRTPKPKTIVSPTTKTQAGTVDNTQPRNNQPRGTIPFNPGINPVSRRQIDFDDTALRALRGERLAAALAAIGAQFDFNRGQLGAERTALESLFAANTKGNERALRDTNRAVGENAADRGILRSGIFAQNLAEATAPIADAQAQNVAQYNPEEGAEGTQIRSIMSALGLLGQQEASAEAGARLEAESDELELEKLIALLGAGLPTG